jgi:cobalt-zinc-cadmium resistance protein CzcA
MGIEQADVCVALAPRKEWRPGLTREALIAQLEQAIETATPRSEPGFTQPIQMRFNELLGGATTDVVASVYGEDLAGLWRAAQALAELSKTVPGVEDVRVLAPPDVPLLEVRPRPDEAALAGLSSMDVLDAVQALRAGLPVGATWQGPQRVPLVLKLQGPASAFDLSATVLPAPGGALVPLSRVADLAALQAPSLVAHENGQRKLGVGFNVRGRTLGEVVAEVRLKSAALPREGNTRVEWGGQIESLEAATRRLLLVVPAVLVLILLVLYATFRRLRPSLIIFTHVPFACVGGVLALAARQMPLSISAAIGLIALSGVAVMNGVVLLTQVLRNEEAGMDAAAAALAAGRTRARPVLMTALVAALGFVPMALATGVGAEVQRPLATVVVGGLITSTVLTLLILPTLYPWMAARRRTRPGAAGLAAPQPQH